VQQQRGLIDQLLSGCILEGCKLRGAAYGSNGDAAMAGCGSSSSGSSSRSKSLYFIAPDKS
jgi:hypothetical protein